MDLATIESLRNHLTSKDPRGIFEHLVPILTKEAERTLRTKEARDGFTAVIRQVRKGKVQVIGTEPRKQVILIAATDLCDLLLSLRERSFMDALRATPGYKPPKKRIAFAERPRSREYTSTLKPKKRWNK
jgi:hypothetical protein